MKRLILTLSAVIAIAGPMSAGVAAAEDGRGRGNGRGAERWEVFDQGGRGGGPGRLRAEPPRGGAIRVDPNGVARGSRGERWERRDPYEDNTRLPQREFRRGGYLPPMAAPPIIEDHARYRLRAPPRGYTWVRVPGGYAMVNEMTGQIFDMVPLR